jgi:hypothetical protein
MSKHAMAIVVASAVVAGGIVYHTITNISDGDVAVFNNVPQQMRGLLVRPGDIVAVRRDGLNPENICETSNDGERFAVQRTSAVYVNELAKQLPTFHRLIAFAYSADDESEPDQVTFVGSIMSARPGRQDISDTCGCEIARRLAHNELVCTTQTALVEAGSDYAQAVRFRRESIWLMPRRFEECGLKPIDLGTLPPCDQLGTVAWDVSVRRFLNVVEQREFDAVPVDVSRRTSVEPL